MAEDGDFACHDRSPDRVISRYLRRKRHVVGFGDFGEVARHERPVAGEFGFVHMHHGENLGVV
jgi:hypothetical protein